MVLFYAVLFFTSIVGIIELLPEIKEGNDRLQFKLQWLYFFLVYAFDFCVFRVWGIFLESALLTRVAFKDWGAYKQYALNFPSILDRFILDPIFSKILVFSLIMVLLYSSFFYIVTNILMKN